MRHKVYHLSFQFTSRIFHINMRWLLLILLLLVCQYNQITALHEYPRPIQAFTMKKVIHTLLPTITIGGAIALQGRAVLADETKRPLEYMPALQGLDYGKVRK